MSNDIIYEKKEIKFSYNHIGLTANTCDLIDFEHVTSMADYALRLFDQITNVNEHSFNNFRMRIGKFLS